MPAANAVTEASAAREPCSGVPRVPSLLAALLLGGCATAPEMPLPRLPALDSSAAEAADAPGDADAEGATGTRASELDLTASFGVRPRITAAPPEPQRNFLRPYLWAAGVSGEITARGVDAEVDESFGDVLDALDFGFMLAYEHRFDSGWSLLTDLFYTKLGEEAEVGPLDVDSTLKLSYLEVSAALPACACDYGRLDAIVGVRAWYASVDLDVGAFGGDKSNQWLDPIVGARWSTPLDEQWTLGLRGDVGGFGIGTASDLSWQVQAMAMCQVSENTSLGIGYRHLSVDRKRGSGADEFETDLALSGLLLGLEYRY
jgi:hypothetical protein